ncbi:hypothetical protein HDV64DRAFT_263396 [Trichoderma sp. TUCIM 5745]
MASFAIFYVIFLMVFTTDVPRCNSVWAYGILHLGGKLTKVVACGIHYNGSNRKTHYIISTAEVCCCSITGVDLLHCDIHSSQHLEAMNPILRSDKPKSPHSGLPESRKWM